MPPERLSDFARKSEQRKQGERKEASPRQIAGRGKSGKRRQPTPAEVERAINNGGRSRPE